MATSIRFAAAPRQQPAAIGRQAIDQEQVSLLTFASNDRVERRGRFDGLPRRRTLAPVCSDLPPHLSVRSPCRGDERDAAKTDGLPLRVAALAAARASQHERHDLGLLHTP